MKMFVYFALKFTQVCMEKFELEQTDSFKKSEFFRSLFIYKSYTLETAVAFSLLVKSTFIFFLFLKRFFIIKTKNVIL